MMISRRCITNHGQVDPFLLEAGPFLTDNNAVRAIQICSGEQKGDVRSFFDRIPRTAEFSDKRSQFLSSFTAVK